jgi:hypothetical protein
MGKYFVKIPLLAIFIITISSLNAQTVRDDIRRDILCAGNNYRHYPEPQKALTPAPAGYVPFYISHYGRHGSRYHNRPDTYEVPWRILSVADKADALTPLGRDVLHRLTRIMNDADERTGEMTPIGAWQQREIARRMVERFPDVFLDGVDIQARSTTMTRCILSMQYFLMQLSIMRPMLDIHHNATHRDMYYLNQQDRHLHTLMDKASKDERLLAFQRSQDNPDRLIQSLFSDTAYVHSYIKAVELDDALFKIAAGIQNTLMRDSLTLLDIFTDDEIYRHWKKDNAWRYVAYGASPITGGVMPYSQRNLLRRIIHEADSCLRLPVPSVNLRFGHETCIMPLACLLDVNGYGVVTDDLESLERLGWAAYRLFPMGGNIQLVFYRRHAKDPDVLFKVLLHEEEATLPLPAVQGPYYRWSDFRAYYLKKLDAYVEQ